MLDFEAMPVPLDRKQRKLLKQQQKLLHGSRVQSYNPSSPCAERSAESGENKNVLKVNGGVKRIKLTVPIAANEGLEKSVTTQDSRDETKISTETSINARELKTEDQPCPVTATTTTTVTTGTDLDLNISRSDVKHTHVGLNKLDKLDSLGQQKATVTATEFQDFEMNNNDMYRSRAKCEEGHLSLTIEAPLIWQSYWDEQ